MEYIENDNYFNTKVKICFFIGIIFILVSCHKEYNYNKEAIELNNKAMEEISSGNLIYGLMLLNEAKEKDETYFLPYYNSGFVYKQLKDYGKAIDEYNIALNKNIPSSYIIIVNLNIGYSYELLHDIENANLYYNEALEILDKIIAEQKNEKIRSNNKLEREMVYFLLNKIEKYNNELKDLLLNKDKNIQNTANLLQNIERKDIVQ
ncbi:MAG: tetratricopeptide repeat protein [Treponema sp.]|jgi:tetratricopeptide (TPR) repeat protein|nr:tetratricopeptide repeat protein [Treponema sp.]